MSVLRGILFDNLGLKLVALLLAVLVYLNVYTDRPASMIVSFPIQLTDLADSLTIAGQPPGAAQVELRATAKQLIRLRLTEPPIKISLAGVGEGHFERALGDADLPIPEGAAIEVNRMVTPRTLALEIDRKTKRRLPVAARIQGEPPGGFLWSGDTQVRPRVVEVMGPDRVVSQLDSVRLKAVALTGRRDTARVTVSPQGLPEACSVRPSSIEVEIPIEPATTRRLAVTVEAPGDAVGFAVSPERVIAIITSPRARTDLATIARVRAAWSGPAPYASLVGRRVGVYRKGGSPSGMRVRFEPELVVVRRVQD